MLRDAMKIIGEIDLRLMLARRCIWAMSAITAITPGRRCCSGADAGDYSGGLFR